MQKRKTSFRVLNSVSVNVVNIRSVWLRPKDPVRWRRRRWQWLLAGVLEQVSGHQRLVASGVQRKQQHWAEAWVVTDVSGIGSSSSRRASPYIYSSKS